MNEERAYSSCTSCGGRATVGQLFCSHCLFEMSQAAKKKGVRAYDDIVKKNQEKKFPR